MSASQRSEVIVQNDAKVVNVSLLPFAPLCTLLVSKERSWRKSCREPALTLLPVSISFSRLPHGRQTESPQGATVHQMASRGADSREGMPPWCYPAYRPLSALAGCHLRLCPAWSHRRWPWR